MTFTEYPQIEQGTSEWLEKRRGLVTASIVKHLVTQKRLSAIDVTCPECGATPLDPCMGKRGGTIKTAHSERAAAARSGPSATILEPASNDTSRRIIRRLAGERISGNIDPVPISDAIWRGTIDEPYAREYYAGSVVDPVRETGFMTRDIGGATIGYSPDGLVGKYGLIEIKSRSQASHLDAILDGHPPADCMAQLQTGLLVSGRDWIDYVSFCSGMRLWVRRVTPDPAWFDVIAATARQAEAAIVETMRIYHDETAHCIDTERLEEGQEITL